jgi:hypothetical protein
MNYNSCSGFGMLFKICKTTFLCPKRLSSEEYSRESQLPSGEHTKESQHPCGDCTWVPNAAESQDSPVFITGESYSLVCLAPANLLQTNFG